MLKRRLAGAQVAVGARHRVGDHVLPGRQVDDEMRHQHVAPLRREPVLIDDAPPGHIARVLRRRLRPELGADGRAHAVGADQEVGPDAGAILEVREHTFATGLEACEVVTGDVALVGEVAAQQTVEMPPGRLDLRQVIAREDAAVGPERDALLEPDAVRLVDGEPQALQRGMQPRMRRDADATFGEFRADPLVDRHVAAGLVQHVAGEQAAHRPAHDDHAQPDGGTAHRTLCHDTRTPVETSVRGRAARSRSAANGHRPHSLRHAHAAHHSTPHRQGPTVPCRLQRRVSLRTARGIP